MAKSNKQKQQDHRDKQKSLGRVRKEFWLTPTEVPQVKTFIKVIREDK